MADVKGKAVSVQRDMGEAESVLVQKPTSHDLVLDESGNGDGALRRLNEIRKRIQTENVSGFSNSAVRRQSIRAPPPPATEVNRSTAQFLFKKELKCSDVGPASRIVIPKGYAEKYLPALTDREGIFMFMDDMDASEIWAFRYRYWRNNRSRMFVLEKTGDFVKARGLQPGDFIMIYKDGQSGRYGVRARKAISQEMRLQHELNRSRNYQADLVAGNGISTYFHPGNNAINNFPTNFPGGVVANISNLKQPLSYRSSITSFSPAGNFW